MNYEKLFNNPDLTTGPTTGPTTGLILFKETSSDNFGHNNIVIQGDVTFPDN